MNSPHPKPISSARTTLLRALLSLASLSAAGAARAELIAYESFNTYANGSLNGKDGGVGWFVPWAANSGIEVVSTPSISRQLLPSGITVGGGNALKLGASHENALNRLFSPRFKGKDVYVSFVFQPQHSTQTGNIPGDTNVFAGWQIMDGAPDKDVDTIGVLGAASSVGARVGARVGGPGNTTLLGTNLAYDTTYFLVIKYSWSNSAYRSARVWLNPANAAEGSQSSAISVSRTNSAAGSNDLLGLLVRTVLGSGASLLVDDIRVATTWADAVTNPLPATLDSETPRDPLQWPFSQNSLWNTPLGMEATLGSASHPLAAKLHEKNPDGTWKVKAQINWDSWTTPINIAETNGPALQIKEVSAGTWTPYLATHQLPRAKAQPTLSSDMANITYNSNGSISIPGNGDGFLALLDPVTRSLTEAYKACWAHNGNSTTNRVLIARQNRVATMSLTGDGWSTPSGRASRLTFTGGLIRNSELSKAATDPKNAIRHALSLALANSQLRNPSTTPSYVWPARAVDGDAATAYSGNIPMGTHFALDPAFDIDSLPSKEGQALAYALRDYGAYVSDRSQHITLYIEQGPSTDAKQRMKTDWQTMREHLRPVTDSNQTHVGGEGARVRRLAPGFTAQ